MESDTRKSVQKEDLRSLIWVARVRSWRMVVAGSVCRRLCREAVALSPKGMHESKRKHKLWQQKLWITVALLDCIELSVCGPRTRMTAIYTSVHLCHVLICYLRCYTGLTQLTVQKLYVSFGQGSSLLWTHTLMPFYSRPIALTQEGWSLVNDVCECVRDWRVRRGE